LDTGIELASGALPVRAVMKPPALNEAVERGAIHHQVLDHGEGSGAPRLDPQLGAVRERAHVELAYGGGALGPVRPTVDHHPAGAADPLAAVVVERDRLFPSRDELLVQHVQHFEERHVRAHVRHVVAREPPTVRRTGLPPDVEGDLHYL